MDEGRKVAVTGCGLLTALGTTPRMVYERLCAGRSGIRPLTGFDTEGLRVHDAAEVGDDPTALMGPGNHRPLDRTGRLAVAAAARALAASGWSAERRAAHEVGLVLGTMFGSVHTISRFDRRAVTAGPRYAKPLDFANSVINAAAGQTAIWHDLRGVNSTVAGGVTAGLQAIGSAVDHLRIGRVDAVLAGGCDELCFESFFGFHQRGDLGGSRNGAPPCTVPFGATRNGFALGEGAGLLMLEGSRKPRQTRTRGWICGHATGLDCSRGRDPQTAIDTVAWTVESALADAGLSAAAIGVVSAGANGSVAGDRAEAGGLLEVLGGRGETLPIMAVKAGLGECLGASGALQTIVLLRAMNESCLPGIRGLEDRADDVPLAGAQPRCRALRARYGLVVAVGLDGQVAALVVERGEATGERGVEA